MRATYRCESCNAHFKASRRLCGVCGTSGVETERETCPSCGTSFEDSRHQRCPRCGASEVEFVTR